MREINGRISGSAELQSRLGFRQKHEEEERCTGGAVTAIDNVEVVRRMTAGLFDQGDLSDVVLLVGDLRLSCHRIILAASSEYFRVLLTGPLRESKQKEIRLHDLRPDSFLAAIRYIYTGRIDLDVHNACNLLMVADRLQIDSLIRECVKYLGQMVTVQTCCAFLSQSNGFPAEIKELRNRCLCTVVSRFDQVIETEGWLSLDYETVCEILRRDDVNTEETKVFHAAMRWMAGVWDCFDSEQNRLAVVDELLSLIRFPTMPMNRLSRLNHEIASKSDLFDKLVLAAIRYQADPSRKDPKLPLYLFVPRWFSGIPSTAKRLTRHTHEQQGWGYSGQPDELVVEFSHAVHLHGVTLFGAQYHSYDLRLDVRLDTSTQSLLQFGSEPRQGVRFSERTQDFMFEGNPVLIQPGQLYVISALIRGHNSPYGCECKMVQEVDGVFVKFHNRTSPNGTDMRVGQFAQLIFSPA